MIFRLLTLTATLSILLAGTVMFVGGGTDILDLKTALVVIGAPLVIALATRGAEPVRTALLDALSPTAEDLPGERRSRSSEVLSGLAGQTLAVGVMTMFAGALYFLSTVASAGGTVTPARLIGNFGGLLLAPFYGLALSAFVYTPLSARLNDHAH